MKTNLANDPTQLQVMLQVARAIANKGDTASAKDVHLGTAQALELLALDPVAARGALAQLKSWERAPAEAADRFLGELAFSVGLDKAAMTEGAVLAKLGRLGDVVGRAKAGLPPGVKLPPGEVSGVWDGQHARLAADFPRIVLGDGGPGTVTLQQLTAGLPVDVGPAVEAAIERGVHPREHLHPGGIVASELVAQLAGLKPGAKVLDLCSGEGGVPRYFAQQHGADVTCYEVSDAASAVAQRKLAESGLDDHVRIVNQSISRIDVEPGSLDAITGTDADGIHYVEERQAVFDRAYDGLKDGGAFVFKAYVPSTRPDGVSEADWKKLTDDFDAGMGWAGEDASMDVRPTGINAEGYVEQLVAAGFDRDAIEVIDLNPMYTAWQTAVGENQAARGHDDGWLKGWLETNQASNGSLGFVIRAKK